MNWLERKRRRRIAWFFFILGCVIGFIFGLMADGAHAAYNETPFAIDWLFPSASTYTTTAGDNGRGLSAFNTSGGLTITLPPNSTTLFPGWHLCAANDNGKVITVNVSGTSGGHILIPKPTGASLASTITLASGDYEQVCLMADTTGGNFRFIWATPSTEASLGMVPLNPSTSPYGIAWLYPASPSYNATSSDYGRGISAFNATISTITITLPPNSSTLLDGWHICAANDNGKTFIFNTNATSGGHIIYPTTTGGVSVTSLTPASGNYEMVCLLYDSSSNFRPVWVTPQTEVSLGMSSVVTGPGSSTGGFVPSWSGSTGKVLATGYPVGNSGASTVLETDSGGHVDSSVIPVLTGHAGALTTGSAPTPTSGATDCGTSPSVAGNDQVGRVTVGSSTNGGKCTLTFVASWTNPPVCSVWNETSGARQLWPQPSATQLVILAQSTLSAADTLAYSCREYQ